MDSLDIVLIVVSIALTTLWWLQWTKPAATDDRLPPGPPGWPVVGNLFQVILQRRPFMYVVRDLRKLYGPIFALRMGQRTLVVVTSADLIHEALVQKGPLFASRPPDTPARLVFSVGKCTVNSAEYGPMWRALRRNFVAEIVSPAKIKGFGWIRDWAIANHMARIRAEQKTTGAVAVMANCRLTICSILACICFGAKLPEDYVKDIEAVLKDVMMMTMPKLPDFLPVLAPLFSGRLSAARRLRKRQMDILVPLVRARKAFVESGAKTEFEMVSPVGSAYVDSLFAVEPANRGPLGEPEIVTLVSEVMSAGTDTSATTLEWALLHLVLDHAAQDRLYEEVVDKGTNFESMDYMAAVIKETLRRHPPSHFLLSHATIRDTKLGGYRIPARANVEFYTAWLTENPSVWKDPKEWRPERFMEGGEGWEVDVTGAKAVRMAPFGVGRRICPAAALGMLHVQLMLARMVHELRWLPAHGRDPSTEETFAFTVVMKEPLAAAVEERGGGVHCVI